MSQDSPIPDQVKPLDAAVARMLSDVEPTVSGYGLRLYPCEVVTDDGATYSRVYVVEARAYIREWGVWPWDDRGKSWIPAEQIRSLGSSPLRLPVKFAQLVLDAGESGMGYCAFSVTLRDRRRLYFVTGNAVDFPNWPPDVRPDDVVAVKPHDRYPAHRDRPPLSCESDADYAWSPFRPT